MKLLEDFLPVLRARTITFLKSRQESGDVVSFEFEKHDDMTWKPGQHGVFMFPRKRVKGLPFRGFSIASSPREEVLRIATRIRPRPSDFKKQLLRLDIGDAVRIRGPFGPFYLTRDDLAVAFIAGGIGITPFLGLLRDCRLRPEKLPLPAHLFYSAVGSVHAFKKEIEDIRGQLPGLHATYVPHREELLQRLNPFVAEQQNRALYYISGPGAMIRSMRHYLRRQGVAARNIHTEWFLGY